MAIFSRPDIDPEEHRLKKVHQDLQGNVLLWLIATARLFACPYSPLTGSWQECGTFPIVLPEKTAGGMVAVTSLRLWHCSNGPLLDYFRPQSNILDAPPGETLFDRLMHRCSYRPALKVIGTGFTQSLAVCILGVKERMCAGVPLLL